MPSNDPVKSVENIVQLPSARRAHPVPALEVPRAQPTQPVLFESWVTARDRAAALLLGGAKRLLLTGPAGTGKTVLIEHVARVLRAAGRTVLIQLADADPAPPGPGVTLFVDEADRLSATKLQQLIKDATGTVVLTGLEPLVRRVPAGTVQVTLDPLGQKGAQEYIAQWLALNGRTPAELDGKAVRALVELSGGVPRLLSTLLAAGAWLARSSDAPIIEAIHIQEAAELRSVLGPPLPPDVAGIVTAPAPGNRVKWSALLAGVVLAGAAVAIVPRLFPAETERAMARASPFVQQAERWLRAEPSAPPPRPVKTDLQPPSPPIVQAAPLAVAPVEPTPAEPARIEQAPIEPPAPSEPPKAAAELPHTETPPEPPPEPKPEPMQAAPEPAPVIPLPEVKPPEVPPPAAAAPAAAPIVAPPPNLPIETIDLLMRRGREMLAIDDLSAARLLFLRAAEGGSSQAMLELGQTYDPAVSSTFGVQSNRAEALRWYRRAAQKGNRAAERLLPPP